jgi:hypothetical protein
MRDDEISVERFRNLMEDVDSDGTLWAHTVYSTIYDLQEKRIYLYYLRNYRDVILIALDDELRKGPHHYDLQSISALPTVVNENDPDADTSFPLLAAYPNPSNTSATISYSLPVSGYVNLCIYDLLGRKVQTVVNGFQYKGEHTASIGVDNGFSSGIYLCRLRAHHKTTTIKIMRAK